VSHKHDLQYDNLQQIQYKTPDTKGADNLFSELRDRSLW